MVGNAIDGFLHEQRREERNLVHVINNNIKLLSLKPTVVAKRNLEVEQVSSPFTDDSYSIQVFF